MILLCLWLHLLACLLQLHLVRTWLRCLWWMTVTCGLHWIAACEDKDTLLLLSSTLPCRSAASGWEPLSPGSPCSHRSTGSPQGEENSLSASQVSVDKWPKKCTMSLRFRFTVSSQNPGRNVWSSVCGWCYRMLRPSNVCTRLTPTGRATNLQHTDIFR